MQLVPTKGFSRRRLLKGLVQGGLCVPLAGLLPALALPHEQHSRPANPPSSTTLSDLDRDFLYELECLTFRYFWEQANPATGLVKDRCNVRAATDKGVVASIAATGFGLTALCIAEEAGFVLRDQAIERVTTTLRSLWKRLPNHRGFFYHWANINTGERIWDSEISSVDTAILLCGVLTCRQHFQNRGDHELGKLNFQSRGLDLAIGRHPLCCRTAGRRKSDSCHIAGTTTAS